MILSVIAGVAPSVSSIPGLSLSKIFAEVVIVPVMHLKSIGVRLPRDLVGVRNEEFEGS